MEFQQYEHEKDNNKNRYMKYTSHTLFGLLTLTIKPGDNYLMNNFKFLSF